jgi:hypothetical protein
LNGIVVFRGKPSVSSVEIDQETIMQSKLSMLNAAVVSSVLALLASGAAVAGTSAGSTTPANATVTVATSHEQLNETIDTKDSDQGAMDDVDNGAKEDIDHGAKDDVDSGPTG